MKDFVKRMIKEHGELCVRIKKLEDYVYSERSDADDKAEFANKCMQLSAMRNYERALYARLVNQNIVITEDGEYLEKVAKIESIDDVTKYNEDNSKENDAKSPILE